MANLLLVGVQTLLTLSGSPDPVRIGVAVPSQVLAQGLGLVGHGVLQWRRLPVGDACSDPVWIELALADARGPVRIVLGGPGPCADGRGPVLAHEVEEQVLACGRRRIDRWAWRTGAVDERVRTVFFAATTIAGETFAVGEALTRWEGEGAPRWQALCRLPRRCWVDAGVLPSGGRLGRRQVERLLAVERRLVEMPGVRGAGDFVRGAGEETVVTNLEYDTALGLLRLGLATRDEEVLARGLRVARHQCDRDLDLRTGLPFVHGQDHRGGGVECGHTWLQGMLLAGLLSADDQLIAASRSIARGLATHPPRAQGRFERARDFAWPLLELEGLLAIDPDPFLQAAADRLAAAIDLRFDADQRTFRFGEGECGQGVRRERGWITGGLVIPALQAHLRRCPNRDLAEHVQQAQRALLEQIGRARPGLPTHWRWAGGRTFAEHRARQDPKALLMLDGLPPADLRRLLRRENMRACLAEVPDAEGEDLPTAFSLAARAWWIYR